MTQPTTERFRPFKIGPLFGSTDQYGIEDLLNNVPNESILRNWQAGKKSKRMWRGTLEQATEMCALLNRDKTVTAKATTGVTSQSQVRYYANTPKRSRRTPTMASFKTCTCGAKYKGDAHCG